MNRPELEIDNAMLTHKIGPKTLLFVCTIVFFSKNFSREIKLMLRKIIKKIRMTK